MTDTTAKATIDTTAGYACQCISLDHDHKWGSQCDRKATWMGGVCTECRYFHTFPERRENL